MVGVLDLDSYSLARFTEEDKSLLETLVNDFSEHTSWPAWARS
jgi:putative methionine-R-sulfoxide reductase with GAF domain